MARRLFISADPGARKSRQGRNRQAGSRSGLSDGKQQAGRPVESQAEAGREAAGFPSRRHYRRALPFRGESCHDIALTESCPPTAAFQAARDLLLRYREDYEGARREFTWPELGGFNWALDWFDVIAAGHPDRTALRIVAGRGRARRGGA
jgi:hypothetical protein